MTNISHFVTDCNYSDYEIIMDFALKPCFLNPNEMKGMDGNFWIQFSDKNNIILINQAQFEVRNVSNDMYIFHVIWIIYGKPYTYWQRYFQRIYDMWPMSTIISRWRQLKFPFFRVSINDLKLKLKNYLKSYFQRDVDICREKYLKPYIKAYISNEVIYVWERQT